MHFFLPSVLKEKTIQIQHIGAKDGLSPICKIKLIKLRFLKPKNYTSYHFHKMSMHNLLYVHLHCSLDTRTVKFTRYILN